MQSVRIQTYPNIEIIVINDNSTFYIGVDESEVEAHIIKGFWTDAGTIESLHRASTLVRTTHPENPIGLLRNL